MSKPYPVALFWFRRSIRLDDNQALCAAIEAAEKIVPVFILDKAILSRPDTGAARVGFLFEALTDVDAELRKRGGKLILREGKPVEELERLIEETGASALYFGRDYEPFSKTRDTAVTAAMQKRGIAVETFSDHLLTEPGEIRTKTGTPYTVFTPFKRAWFDYPLPKPIAAPERVSVVDELMSVPLPAAPASGQSPVVQGSAAEGERWLQTFLKSCLSGYDTDRDFPGLEGTSRLSAYLRSGVVSVRRVLAETQARRADFPRREGADTFLSELAWRDFYYQILSEFPYVADGAFKTALNAVQWENDETLFQAWRDGKTGYPIVDAAMRQMNREAWMHNRARMVVASFLTKDLLCDWRLGEKYFMQKLIDGDLAPNNGGWQWAAGTGTDAQPYFRIFNPSSQGEKFDPDGAYVKKWLPELKRIPAKFVHKPWELSAAEQAAVGCILGKDYPRPIVDHKMQREKALGLYKRVSAGEDSGSEGSDLG